MLNMMEVLNRVSEVIGLTANKDIATELNVEPNVCSNWKTRNTVPWENLFRFCIKRSVSMNWLLTGKERTEPEPLEPETSQAIDAVKEIMASENDYAKAALASNLIAFKAMVAAEKDAAKKLTNKEKEIKKKNEQIEGLEKRVDKLEKERTHIRYINDPPAIAATGTENGTDT